jgi:exodeoxyribonuclease X
VATLSLRDLYNPILLTTFTFGKYRGKAVSEVAENDPGYLRWLFNNLDRMRPWSTPF